MVLVLYAIAVSGYGPIDLLKRALFLSVRIFIPAKHLTETIIDISRIYPGQKGWRTKWGTTNFTGMVLVKNQGEGELSCFLDT